MRSALIFVAAAGVFLSGPARAQQWSPQQQEVLDAVKACWDLWMESVEQATPDPWIASCQTEDVTFWVATDGAPNVTGGEFLRRGWGTAVGNDLGWIDLRPIHIGVRDGVAVLHFYGYWRAPGPELVEWKRTEIWRWEDGRWRQWVGHATPVERG